MIKRHWGFLLGLLLVCAVAYADSVGKFDGLFLRPGTLPATCKDGEFRYDSDASKFKGCISSAYTEIGGGGSGVGTNYFSDFQADTVSNVVEFDDSSAIVDGTGGTAANLSQSSETSAPLSGDASYKLTKAAADASYEGWAVTTDTPDRTSTVGGETVYVTFNYETSANYDNSSSSEQVSVYVYRVGSNTLEACNTRDVLSGSFTNALPVAPDGGQYQCTTTLSSSDTSVRIIFGITGTGTSTWDLVVDKIKVGPDATVTAPIVTERQDVTCTGSWTTNSTYSCSMWRVGDTLFVEGFVTVSGSGSTGNLTLTLPNALSIDTVKFKNDNTNSFIEGKADLYDSGTGHFIGRITYVNSTTLGVRYLRNFSGTQYLTTVDHTDPWGTLANGDTVYFEYQVPISGWSGNAILSTTQADQQTVRAVYEVSTSTANASFADATFERIDADTKITDSHNSVTTGASWLFTAPRSGLYTMSVAFAWDSSTNLSRTVVRAIVSDGNNIRFIDSDYSLATYQGAHSTEFYLQKGDTVYFEAYQDDSTSAARNIERDRSADNRTRISIVSHPDFSTFSTYGPYEYTEAEVTGLNRTVSANTYVDATGASISLNPGTWNICAEGSNLMEWVSGATGVSCKAIIRDGSNADLDDTAILFYLALDASYNAAVIPFKMCSEVTITTTTTYKLSIKSSVANTAATCDIWDNSSAWSAGITDPDGTSKIWARRMK